jgi:hypothetical protein
VVSCDVNILYHFGVPNVHESNVVEGSTVDSIVVLLLGCPSPAPFMATAFTASLRLVALPILSYEVRALLSASFHFMYDWIFISGTDFLNFIKFSCVYKYIFLMYP